MTWLCLRSTAGSNHLMFIVAQFLDKASCQPRSRGFPVYRCLTSEKRLGQPDAHADGFIGEACSRQAYCTCCSSGLGIGQIVGQQDSRTAGQHPPAHLTRALARLVPLISVCGRDILVAGVPARSSRPWEMRVPTGSGKLPWPR